MRIPAIDFPVLATARLISLLAICCLIAILLVQNPILTFTICAGIGILALAFLWFTKKDRIHVWQFSWLLVLSGFVLFNYGFANLVIHLAGFPIIVGHIIALASLFTGILAARGKIGITFKDPSLIFLIALGLFAIAHLIFDVETKGFLAIRDASLYFESVFFILGFLWVFKDPDLKLLMRWFFVIFVLNLVYCLFYPWRLDIAALSPRSGIFRPVPVFGSFDHSYLFLFMGGFFCLWIVKYIKQWPAWIFQSLAIFQFLGLAILQARSMYVGFVLTVMVLIFLAEGQKFTKIMSILLLAFCGLILISPILSQYKISGRLGPVSIEFIYKHFQTIAGGRHDIVVSPVETRLQWMDEVLQQTTSDTRTLIFGQGFGHPLINFTISNTETGIVQVRQPHNTHLSVFARLGLVGLILWIGFHITILLRFVYAIRNRWKLDQQHADFVLWLFLFHIQIMLVTSVEPLLEFSYGAIPFYFLTGASMAFLRQCQEPSKQEVNPVVPAFRSQRGALSPKLIVHS